MKATITAALLLAITISPSVLAGNIDQLAWSESNIAALRELDKAAVEKFVNQLSQGDVHKTVGEYTWLDLAGDGRYQLVTTLDLSGRSFFDYLAVYQREASGDVKVQWFPEETAVGKLSGVIRDLNGDGKKELVVPTLFPSGSYGAETVSAVWPAVYRLENGTYIEASSEFASFYDADVLPQLEKRIVESQAETRTSEAYSRTLVSETLERDKILRVLGRDRTAGIDAANQWTRSHNASLASAGIAVIKDIDSSGKPGTEKNVPRVFVLPESTAG